MWDGSDEFVWAVYVARRLVWFAWLLSDCIVRRRRPRRVSPLSYRAIRRVESRLERLRAMQQERALLLAQVLHHAAERVKIHETRGEQVVPLRQPDDSEFLVRVLFAVFLGF